MVTSKIKEFASSLWWLFTIQGTVTIIFGLVALFWPLLTLEMLIALFALFVVAVGLADLISAFIRMRSDKWWWLSLAAGIAAIIVGTFLISHGDTKYELFAAIVGVFFVVRGLIDIFVSSIVEQDEDKMLWVFAGILAIIAGVTIFIFPYIGTITFVWVLGLYAVIRGSVDVAMAVRTRVVADDMLKKGVLKK